MTNYPSDPAGRQKNMMNGKRKHVDEDDSEDEGILLAQSTQHIRRQKASNSSPKKTPKASGKKSAKGDDGLKIQKEEKRLRRYRKGPPQSYLEIKARALTQRLTVQSRERCGTDKVPEEKVFIAGSTGNLYTVHVGRVPSCDCPHALKGNQCKHIIYVMLRVLKAPENIAYQLALTSSELRDLFQNATPIPEADSEADSSDGNRKPIEGDCPICYTELEPDKEAIVYCKAACGNNIHKDCMDNWTKARNGKATCPMCRSKWVGESLAGKIVNLEGATRSEEGYVNIGSQLGLSGQRDYSTYHPYWVEQQQRGTRGGRRGYRNWS